MSWGEAFKAGLCATLVIFGFFTGVAIIIWLFDNGFALGAVIFSSLFILAISTLINRFY